MNAYVYLHRYVNSSSGGWIWWAKCYRSAHWFWKYTELETKGYVGAGKRCQKEQMIERKHEMSYCVTAFASFSPSLPPTLHWFWTHSWSPVLSVTGIKVIFLESHSSRVEMLSFRACFFASDPKEPKLLNCFYTFKHMFKPHVCP